MMVFIIIIILISRILLFPISLYLPPDQLSLQAGHRGHGPVLLHRLPGLQGLPALCQALPIPLLQPQPAALFWSVQFSSVEFSSVELSSVQLSSVQFSSDKFSSVQFRQTHRQAAKEFFQPRGAQP